MKKLIFILIIFLISGTCFGQNFFWSHSGALPIVTTETPINTITDNSAKGGGTVVSTGGLPITYYGLCWNTSTNPTTANSHTTNNSGSVTPFTFTSWSFSGLTASTLYYVRAYATNAIGTSYGDNVTFTTATTYSSAAIYDYYTRNDCGSGYYGTDVPINFAVGAYTSYISQIDADNQAQVAAQADANSSGDCIADEVTYYSAAISETYYRNDCTGDYCGYGGVINISEGAFTSIVSQAAADAAADAEAQAEANATFECYYCGIAMIQNIKQINF